MIKESQSHRRENFFKYLYLIWSKAEGKIAWSFYLFKHKTDTKTLLEFYFIKGDRNGGGLCSLLLYVIVSFRRILEHIYIVERTTLKAHTAQCTWKARHKQQDCANFFIHVYLCISRTLLALFHRKKSQAQQQITTTTTSISCSHEARTNSIPFSSSSTHTTSEWVFGSSYMVL